MDRYYQCFKTKEDRVAWERDQKRNDKRFHVCFRETVKQLARDVYLTDDVKHAYKYATVYTYRDREANA